MVDSGSGMVFGCIVGWFGGSLDDGVKFEGRRYLDQRDVEYFGGHSISYHADVVSFDYHFGRFAVVVLIEE